MAKKIIQLDEEAQYRIVEKSKLTKEERFALDGFIVSKETTVDKMILAYSLSRVKPPTTNQSSLEQQAYRWKAKDSVKFYLEDREVELFGLSRVVKNGEVVESNISRSKEETLEELNLLANTTQDVKLKAELLMKIADLENWKKKEDEDKESRINYFTPLKCYDCALYNKQKAAIMTKKEK